MFQFEFKSKLYFGLSVRSFQGKSQTLHKLWFPLPPQTPTFPVKIQYSQSSSHGRAWSIWLYLLVKYQSGDLQWTQHHWTCFQLKQTKKEANKPNRKTPKKPNTHNLFFFFELMRPRGDRRLRAWWFKCSKFALTKRNNPEQVVRSCLLCHLFSLEPGNILCLTFNLGVNSK